MSNANATDRMGVAGDSPVTTTAAAGVSHITQVEYGMATYGKGTYTESSKNVEPVWYVVDAENEVLGRLASRIAKVLRGKHRVTYSPHMDLGDSVIVVNAEKVKVTGNKRNSMAYFHYTGYPGGGRIVPFEKMMQKDPTEAVRHAVRGMLPKGALGFSLLGKLRVYAGSEHPHVAQNPQPLP